MEGILRASYATPYPGLQDVFQEIEIGGSMGLKISFLRTLQLPDDDVLHDPPRTYGALPIYSTALHKNTLPPRMAARTQSCFIPAYKGEELTIKFESQNGPFAIRTFASGVNILSRETPDSIEPGQVHLEISHRDYCIVPGQVFLDGIMQSDGSAKQIVTRPVEPHARGKDQFDGLQFEVIPSPSCLLDMNRWTPLNTEMTVCRNPAPPQAQMGKTDLSDGHSDCFSITINFLASGKAEIFKVRGTTKIQALKRALVELKDVPFMALRLFHGKTQLEDERTLQSYGITQDTIIYCLFISSGGAGPEMAMVEGDGLIDQTISSNAPENTSWRYAKSVLCNVQILSADAFQNLLGFEPPESQITARQYAEEHLPAPSGSLRLALDDVIREN